MVLAATNNIMVVQVDRGTMNLMALIKVDTMEPQVATKVIILQVVTIITQALDNLIKINSLIMFKRSKIRSIQAKNGIDQLYLSWFNEGSTLAIQQ